MNLAEKTVVITGAAQGLGLAIARAVAEQGAAVALLDHDQPRLAQAVQEVGAQARGFACDIRDLEAVRRTVEQVWQWRPQVDILVNNAGVWTDNDLELADPSRRQLAVDTNLLGHLQLTQEMLPQLRAQGSGHILNVISTSGDALTPSGDNTAWMTYGATSGG